MLFSGAGEDRGAADVKVCRRSQSCGDAPRALQVMAAPRIAHDVCPDRTGLTLRRTCRAFAL